MILLGIKKIDNIIIAFLPRVSDGGMGLLHTQQKGQPLGSCSFMSPL